MNLLDGIAYCSDSDSDNVIDPKKDNSLAAYLLHTYNSMHKNTNGKIVIGQRNRSAHSVLVNIRKKQASGITLCR